MHRAASNDVRQDVWYPAHIRDTSYAALHPRGLPVTTDQNQPPADPGQRAGTSETERQNKITQLTRRRSKLSTEEAALLRELFPDILAAHHEQVWNHLRRRVPSSDDAEELYQDVFLALHTYILEHGFPDSIPRMLNAITKGKLSNYIQAKTRFPPSVALPSSSSEKASAPDLDRAIDLRELAQHIRSQLSPEHQEVVQKVILNGLSHGEAAEVMGLTEGQLKGRVVAAKRAMLALAEPLLPRSQRETA
jgi:RNA polymerase sigma-70 factor (ECF subfamily)